MTSLKPYHMIHMVHMFGYHRETFFFLNSLHIVTVYHAQYQHDDENQKSENDWKSKNDRKSENSLRIRKWPALSKIFLVNDQLQIVCWVIWLKQNYIRSIRNWFSGLFTTAWNQFSQSHSLIGHNVTTNKPKSPSKLYYSLLLLTWFQSHVNFNGRAGASTGWWASVHWDPIFDHHTVHICLF